MSERLDPAAFAFDERETACLNCHKTYTQRRLKAQKDRGWPHPICPQCVDLEDERVANEERKAEIRQHADSLVIPPLYTSATFESWETHGSDTERSVQIRVLARAETYCDEWPNVPSAVVFMGGPGTGKGHMSWAIVRKLAETHGVLSKVTNVPDLIRDLRESWGRPELATESERLTAYREPELLVVDEVSAHAFYGEPSRHLYDLVNYRIEWMRPTILTTNEDASDFAELLGPALSSRLAGQSHIWNFGHTDYRLVQVEKRFRLEDQ